MWAACNSSTNLLITGTASDTCRTHAKWRRNKKKDSLLAVELDSGQNSHHSGPVFRSPLFLFFSLPFSLSFFLNFFFPISTTNYFFLFLFPSPLHRRKRINSSYLVAPSDPLKVSTLELNPSNKLVANKLTSDRGTNLLVRCSINFKS